ncbi:carboxypeptidase regulatory-like domain-containing protein [Nocardiaceae bacterium NPDC056970]
MLFAFRFRTRVPVDAAPTASPDPTGHPLLLTGRIQDRDGRPVRGATVQVRRSDCSGGAHAGTAASWATTDDDGSYTISTTTPVPYQISTDGPTGWFIANEKWSPWRPAHLHVTVRAPRMRTATTRLYFRRDTWTRHDAPESAILDPSPGTDGIDRAVYDFVLECRESRVVSEPRRAVTPVG